MKSTIRTFLGYSLLSPNSPNIKWQIKISSYLKMMINILANLDFTCNDPSNNSMSFLYFVGKSSGVKNISNRLSVYNAS